ncbi:MAG: hypothetical protein ACR2KQ_00830 [Actinomycetota bacterium]
MRNTIERVFDVSKLPAGARYVAQQALRTVDFDWSQIAPMLKATDARKRIPIVTSGTPGGIWRKRCRRR